LSSISFNSESFTKKSIVVWNGYEKKYTNNIIIEKSNYGKIVVLLVGRFNRMKGQMFILDCIKYLPPKIQNLFLFRFVGSPPSGQEFYLTNFIHKANEFILDGTVEIHSFTDNIEMQWNAADIAIVPSIEPESFGLVAIEAMAHHLPVIASNIGGLREIVVHNETGFLFEPKSIVQFCDHLMKLIDINTRDKLGLQSYDRYIENFTLKMYKSKIYNIYSEVI
jgi:glycosyltransferase involved in cell wall biosynthesis